MISKPCVKRFLPKFADTFGHWNATTVCVYLRNVLITLRN